MDSSPEAPLVSLCTTVMNRLHHLRRTLPANIAANYGFDRLEYVILDYSSSDGLADWVRTDLAAHVASGLVRFAQLPDRAHFQMAHAKNLSHRLARGGIVCNMDADNFSGCGFADYLMREFSSRSSIFVKGKGHGLGGRLAFRRDQFLALGGYDEAMADGWGHEDADLATRALRSGYKQITCHGFGKAIQHGDGERISHNVVKNKKESWRRHRMISRRNIQEGRLIANAGAAWGAGKVLVNFHTVISV